MKRAVALLMAASMVLGLCGCGSKTAETKEAVATTQAQAGETSAAKESDSQPSEKPVEISMLLIQYNQPPREDGEFWKWMESTYGVDLKIEWVAESSYNDRLALALSTGDIPDIVQIPQTTAAPVVNAVNSGLLKDLTPYLDFDKYENLGKISSASWTNSKIDGKYYVFPRSRGQYNVCLFLRGDMLDQMNMEVPSTIDELTEYFRGIKALQPDMIPLPMEVDTITSFAAGAFGPGEILPVFTEDKTGIIDHHLTDAYADCIEWLSELYAEGLYASEFALYKTDRNQEVVLAGKGGARHQNVWHRYRLSTELQKAVPDGYFVPCFGVSTDKGQTVEYDAGLYGGYGVSADVSEEKLLKILDFYNSTSDPEMYNTFTYGLEGTYWNMVDGFPKLTELGNKEVTNSFYGPYVRATFLYDKVDSPLADADYNKETREMVKKVDELAANIDGAPFKLFNIISSNAWSEWWSVNKGEFEGYVADTITGKHSIEDFRKYQADILALDEIQTANKEYKASYDSFGLADFKLPEMN